MATTGESVWKSLIARQKVIETPFSEVKDCYLSFSFGKWIRFTTKAVPIRDFQLRDYEFNLSSRIRPVVYLHFRFRRVLDIRARSVGFRLVWPYYWVARNGVQVCKFPFRSIIQVRVLSGPDSGKYVKVRVIYLRTPLVLKRKFRVITMSPAKLFNLSLITPILWPRTGVTPVAKVVKRREPFARKTFFPRPNPEVKTVSRTNATEFFGTPYSETAGSYETFRRAWTGTTTPGFGGMRASLLPVNPHTVNLVKTNWSDGYDLRRTYASPSTTYSNAWGAYLFPFTAAPISQSESLFLDCENAAIANLNWKANAGIQANVALTLAEYRQFGSMVASTANRITKSIKALKRGQFSKAADALFDGSFKMQGTTTRGYSIKPGNPSKGKSLARNWLELQYGWKPLLSDALEGSRTLVSYLENAGRTQEVLGSATRSRVGQNGIKGPIPTASDIGFQIASTMVRCKFGVTFQIRPDNFSFLSQFGFTNPINLVWELLPYSFVVDWFLPIGPWLESFSAPHSVEFLDGYKTRFGKRYLALEVSHNGSMPGALGSELRAYAMRTQLSVTLDRSKLLAWPTQRFPQLKNPFSNAHILNALALMRVAFRD